MNWRWISLAALLAAIAIGYGAFHRRSGAPIAAGAAPPQPGYYLNSAIITQTQQDGSIGSQLIADRIEQRPSDDAIALEKVRVHYFQARDKEWILTAQRGLVPAESSIIELSGDVHLRPSDVERTFLRTEALAIDAERNVARALHRPTTVEFGGHRMTVQDFTADLDSEKVRMESVRGAYESR